MTTMPTLKLYAFHLPDPVPFEDYTTLLSLLSPAEQARAQRYRLPEDRLRSLISRVGLWWHLLDARLLDARTAPAPAFKARTRGKPDLVTPVYLPGPGPESGPATEGTALSVGFNASHEGKWVLLGVAEQTQDASQSHSLTDASTTTPPVEVGVDVMVPPSDPIELKDALIPQMTTPERLAMSVPLTPSQLRWTLTALWALKEGYTKAVGDGVGFGLQRIEVDFGTLTQENGDGASERERGVRLKDSLPVRGVRVDGRDVVDDGWRWTVGSVGEGMDEVGYAMYWREALGRGAGGPEVEVVQWDKVVQVFDAVPCYAARHR